MTEDYVAAKVKEALKVSSGDKHAAQKLLVTWAIRDMTLLIGLAKPHLKAIIASRIDHELRAPKKTAHSQGSDHFSESDLKSLAAAKPYGEKRSGSSVPPPKSSQRQATAIHQLVAAFKRKK